MGGLQEGQRLRLLDRYRKCSPASTTTSREPRRWPWRASWPAAAPPGSPLTDQRVVILGAGAAGIGIARLLRDTLPATRGSTGEALITRHRQPRQPGARSSTTTEIRDVHKRDFAWPAALAAKHGPRRRSRRAILRRSSRACKPTVLIGTSGEPGTFTEAVVREMAQARRARPSSCRCPIRRARARPSPPT